MDPANPLEACSVAPDQLQLDFELTRTALWGLPQQGTDSGPYLPGLCSGASVPLTGGRPSPSCCLRALARMSQP